MSAAHSAHGHGVTGSTPTLKWSTPAGWEEVPAGQMRAASFRVKGTGKEVADVGVFPLPGMAGSDLGNVNRWRGQVGLDPIGQEELERSVETVDVGGSSGYLYEMAGLQPGQTGKTRIMGAILRREGMAWFFKMTGDDGLVSSQKEKFRQFLKSVVFVEEPAGSPERVAGDATPSAPGSKPQWVVPAGWKEGAAGQFLAAKYMITGDGGREAAVNVSVSAGDGGGVLGNVNRWRGQLGLTEASAGELKVEKFQVDSGEATLVDLKGTDARTSQPARLIGAVVPQPGQTWFYKLMGDDAVVEREKDAFIKFIKSAKY